MNNIDKLIEQATKNEAIENYRTLHNRLRDAVGKLSTQQELSETTKLSDEIHTILTKLQNVNKASHNALDLMKKMLPKQIGNYVLEPKSFDMRNESVWAGFLNKKERKSIGIRVEFDGDGRIRELITNIGFDKVHDITSGNFDASLLNKIITDLKKQVEN
jgi:seryl-tRNA synthetase